MQYVDTNVFLRYLTRDDPAKAQACFELLQRAERNEAVLFTSETVIAEIVYILSSKRLYGLAREEISMRMLPILTLAGLRLPDRSVCLRALELYAAHAIDFEDALAVAHMERQGMAEIYSYDRHFDRVAGVRRLEPEIHE